MPRYVSSISCSRASDPYRQRTAPAFPGTCAIGTLSRHSSSVRYEHRLAFQHFLCCPESMRTRRDSPSRTLYIVLQVRCHMIGTSPKLKASAYADSRRGIGCVSFEGCFSLDPLSSAKPGRSFVSGLTRHSVFGAPGRNPQTQAATTQGRHLTSRTGRLQGLRLATLPNQPPFRHAYSFSPFHCDW